MLFNSPVFMFVFLPVVLVVFYSLGACRQYRAARIWLVAASFFFYGWWNPPYVCLLGGSIALNYTIGSLLARVSATRERRLLLTFGVVTNIILLGYFKYAGFIVNIINEAAQHHFAVAQIVLPLAISFFTFTQIAYLVDISRGKVQNCGLLDYCLFVTFFPHLIAGPIVHHWQLIPQFRKMNCRFCHENFSVGLTLFLVGLFQKVLLADTIAGCAKPVFDAATRGTQVSIFAAWIGVLAYTVQIYFDFSGYSNMAIGLARMFGITFPVNFNSPYKSSSIIEFWRRWHITLSLFLREYIYFSLGGNRKGKFRRYANLLLTMLIGGLWHGAGWTFVLWGALHGIYLMVNHGWREFRVAIGLTGKCGRGWQITSSALTFFCVAVGWVFFRAANWSSAVTILKAIVGANGISLPARAQGFLGPLASKLSFLNISFGGIFEGSGVTLLGVVWTLALVALTQFAPNAQQWLAHMHPTLDEVERPIRRCWRPTPATGMILGVLLFFAVLNCLTAPPSEFVYFKF